MARTRRGGHCLDCPTGTFCVFDSEANAKVCSGLCRLGERCEYFNHHDCASVPELPGMVWGVCRCLSCA